VWDLKKVAEMDTAQS